MDVSNLPHKLFVHACARGRKYGWVLTFQPSRHRSVGLEMDRSHWPDPGSFTYFEGYEALQDCGGSHGNRVGCLRNRITKY